MHLGEHSHGFMPLFRRRNTVWDTSEQGERWHADQRAHVDGPRLQRGPAGPSHASIQQLAASLRFIVNFQIDCRLRGKETIMFPFILLRRKLISERLKPARCSETRSFTSCTFFCAVLDREGDFCIRKLTAMTTGADRKSAVGELFRGLASRGATARRARAGVGARAPGPHARA